MRDTGGPVRGEALLAARGLSVRYGGHVALEDFDVTLEPGRLAGLIGPDGAGKSTAIRALCGLVPHSAGSITVEGSGTGSMRRRMASLVGYMPQRFSLYTDLTIDENIAFYARLHGVRVERERHDLLLDKMGLGPFGGRLAGRLSGGMKQKLALLCVLVHEPRLIVMDEPTTGVDPASRREFWRILGELASQGMGILVATPYLDEAERCHEVLLMHEGRTIMRGDPDVLVGSLDRPIFEVPAADGFALKQRLDPLPWVASVQVFGTRLHVMSRDPTAGRQDVEAWLALEGIDASVSEVEATLEDVFIEHVRA
jgi:ABC-2 type transport system ATP-binding protein